MFYVQIPPSKDSETFIQEHLYIEDYIYYVPPVENSVEEDTHGYVVIDLFAPSSDDD